MEEFDFETISKMSREELISLLGENQAAEFSERLANRSISYEEFEEMCSNAFTVSKQARVIRDLIVLKLSKEELFSMFVSDKGMQQQYEEYTSLRERANSGKLNAEELKKLCDVAFGEGSELSKKMQLKFIRAGLINEEQTDMERDWLYK